MLRFYLIAAVIVIAFGSVVFAHRFASNGWKLQAQATGPPSRAQGNSNEGFVTTPAPFFIGQGSWVMSALPACFVQQMSKEGPSRLMRDDVPQDALRIAPGTTLRRASCTVLVRAHDVWVNRGADRLRVPPEARLFNGPQGLTLVHEHAGRTEVRVYEAAEAESQPASNRTASWKSARKSPNGARSRSSRTPTPARRR